MYKIVCFIDLTDENAWQAASFQAETVTTKMNDVALYLRNEIQKFPTHKLPNALNLADIERGEIDIPQPVLEFISRTAFNKPYDAGLSVSQKVVVKSMAADLVFIACGRRNIPSKQLRLGLAMKSLTGNSKVLTVLNKMGHSASVSVFMKVYFHYSINTSNNHSEQNTITQYTIVGHQLKNRLQKISWWLKKNKA